MPAPAIAHGQVQLRDLVQGGEVKTDTSTLSLALTVPQAAVLRTEEGYIAPVLGRGDTGADALVEHDRYNTRAKGAAKDTNDDFMPGWIPAPTCSAGSFATAARRKTASGE